MSTATSTGKTGKAEKPKSIYTKLNINAFYLIFKVFHHLKKLKRKIVIPFLRPFAKNDIFLLYIVFFHKLQKVSKKVYKNIFLIFCMIFIDIILYTVYYNHCKEVLPG